MYDVYQQQSLRTRANARRVVYIRVRIARYQLSVKRSIRFNDLPETRDFQINVRSRDFKIVFNRSELI